MTERLLQYIWQFRYFDLRSLCGVDGETIQVIYPGNLNTNQGPDFLEATIKVANTIWAGSIELHLRSSDWKNHNHSSDRNYKNVILHVVWIHDVELDLPFPTLELQYRVSKLLFERYDDWMRSSSFIPCEKNIHQVSDIIWIAWKDRLLIERMQRKSLQIHSNAVLTNHHWEEVFWWQLAGNFGLKINSDAFEKIARSLPVTLLAKHKNQIHQTEALLLGQAGLLENNFIEAYPKLLQREYRFLQKKYKLVPISETVSFLRMRPSAFPTVRLAQLAMLIHNSVHLFSKIKEIKEAGQVKKLLDVTANDYWHNHYVLDVPSVSKEKRSGIQMIENLMINTIAPLLFCYGQYYNEKEYCTRAVNWLVQIPAEKNAVIKGFRNIGISSNSAFESQALLQLKNEYCSKKKCLDCAVGNNLLKRADI